MSGIMRIGSALICAALVIAAFSGAAQAQEMTYQEYKDTLAGYEARTAEARRALQECKTANDGLRAELGDADKQIVMVKNEISQLLGYDWAAIEAYLAELDRIEARLMGLLNLSDEALFEKRDEFDSIVARVDEMKKDKRALLPDAKTKLARVDQLVERVKARMPRKRIKPYTVVRGDNLWNISKKPSIYNDPYLWPRIFVENKDKIKNPDLIYPNWVLNVPFGVDLTQHLVMRGENLSAIAATVYKDVTKWNRIYRANQNQILDPGVIFPAQVLEIPAN